MPKRIFFGALGALLIIAATPALAGDDRRGQGPRWHHAEAGRGHHHKAHAHHHGRGHHHAHASRHHHKHHRKHAYSRGHHYHGHGKKHGHAKARYYGQHYGHGHHDGHHRVVRRQRHDDWAFYAILALRLAEALNDNQRASFAQAQRHAAAAPLGETIRWNDGGAKGRVVALREGSDGAGRYCREFQQEVIVGKRRQSAYGIACRQPDGDWEIAS